MSGKVINLGRVRKQRNRIKKRMQGAENAVKFGRSKDARAMDEARAAQAERALDAHRRERADKGLPKPDPDGVRDE